MTLDEIVRMFSEVRADDVMRTVAARFDERHVRYAVIGDIPRVGACVDVAIERSARKDAIDLIESLGYPTILDCTGQSHHMRGIVWLRLHYVDSRTFDSLLAGSTREDVVVVANDIDDATLRALLRESACDLPPSREITPPDAEPFVL